MNYVTYLTYPQKSVKTGWYYSLEVAIGVLLVISHMFWLFVAQLMK